MQNKEDIDVDYLNIMLYNFEHSIKNNLDTVYLGYNIFENNDVIQYWVEKENWAITLDILIQGAIDLEEYEFAYEFKNIKEKL